MLSAHLHLVINLPRRLSFLYRLFHNTWQPLQAIQKQWTKFISQIRVLSDSASNLWSLLCFDNAQFIIFTEDAPNDHPRSACRLLQSSYRRISQFFKNSIVHGMMFQSFRTPNEYKLSDYCNAKVSVTLKRRQTRRIFAQTFFIFSFLCSLLTPDIVGPTCYETACINLF